MLLYDGVVLVEDCVILLGVVLLPKVTADGKPLSAASKLNLSNVLGFLITFINIVGCGVPTKDFGVVSFGDREQVSGPDFFSSDENPNPTNVNTRTNRNSDTKRIITFR